jgi:hypothetical protein
MAGRWFAARSGGGQERGIRRNGRLRRTLRAPEWFQWVIML